jgi:hypothetical protein
VTAEEHALVVGQLRELCGFLPTLSKDAELGRLQYIYQHGGRHMLDSENVHRIVAAAQEHVKELRKLARLLAVECRKNLARHSPPGRH